jgi:hypothetical protein
MEHTLWVVLVAMLGVNPNTGLPTVDYEVHSTHMRQQVCIDIAQPMIEDAKDNPRIEVQCVPVVHPMVW